MKAHILIAAHKPYDFPSDPIYTPIHVGSVGRDTVPHAIRDDVGDQISDLNSTYCELTGLYWLWKNGPEADIYGLAHYRRFFSGTAPHPSGPNILGHEDVNEALGEASVVLARRRLYGIETVRSHYAHAHHEKDLDLARKVIADGWPDYVPAFDRLMDSRSLSLYNMFLMRSDAFHAYCPWVFGILERVHGELDMTGYSDQDKRAIGFLGERLLNVWAMHHADDLGLTYRKVVQVEGEPVLKKGVDLLRRKLRGAK
ncbi:DUF4422 domain-containing protein [Nocardioides sp. S5]|uniref:DUF4422 domain-containing protein n=1 Tax=Nocardioides sp. S5 TaxID=2017486 RepID=UPI001A8EB628|nr:DUF4422 domain-containing protein [Nocardioides sp. S5]